jgi:hypothetical protein
MHFHDSSIHWELDFIRTIQDWQCKEMGLISSGGSLRGQKGFEDRIIGPYCLEEQRIFLGKVFGNLKSHQGLLIFMDCLFGGNFNSR